MCECIASLENDWNSGLTQLCETASEDELANALNNLVRCCRFNEGVLLEPFSDATADMLRNNVLCEPVLLYKGVAFYEDDPPKAGATPNDGDDPVASIMSGDGAGGVISRK